MKNSKPEGALYLLPSHLEGMPISAISNYEKQLIDQISVFAVENVKPARRFIKAINRYKDIDACEFIIIGKYADENASQKVTHFLKKGLHVGLLSDCGSPAIADPGAQLVDTVHRNGFRVVPIAGPSSITLALMASGLNGQSFQFHGYLPVDGGQRIRALKKLETWAKKGQTQLFIETPYRNKQMYAACLDTLMPNTKLCLAVAIGSPDEMIKTKTIGQWRSESTPEIHKKPAVFLLGV